MASKKRSAIWDLVLLIPCIMSYASNLTALVRYQAKQTGKNAATVIVLSIVAALLLICIWMNLLAVACTLLLFYLHWSLLKTVLIMLLLNLSLFAVIGHRLGKATKNLLPFLNSTK